jgi:hypothetical protein
MKLTNNYRYDADNEPVLQEVRKDFLNHYWKPMEPNSKYEKDRQNGNEITNGSVSHRPIKAFAGRPGLVPPQGSSMMPQ